jgi:Tol biopolymer transport system component
MLRKLFVGLPDAILFLRILRGKSFSTPTPVTAGPYVPEATSPALSPDGRFIVASIANGQKLLLFDVRPKKWFELAQVPAGFTQWSADGKYVYFDNGLSKDPAIFRIRLSDRKVERLVSLKDFRREVLEEGLAWMGLTPDGSPLLMRDTGSQEVYSLDFEIP